MSVRDLLVFAIVFGSLPFVLRQPYIGIMVWSWLAYMNPHRLTWGPAWDFPFSQVIGLVTIAGLVLSRAWQKIPLTPITAFWLVFFIWTVVTTIFALSPGAMDSWDKWWKVQLFALFTLILMQTRPRIEALAAIVVFSLGFYGVKGGLFTIATGGNHYVLGPERSFIAGNTEIGLALIMVLPLIGYFQLQMTRWWAKWALAGSMVLTVFAIFSTQSRGAFLGVVAMGAFLVVKSGKALKMGFAALVLGIVVLSFMPQSWQDKMRTIETYQEDQSAMGRINAWWFAYNLAVERPIIGGGFSTFTPELFEKYAPDPEDFHAAHSIYFQVLGEHSFFGLFLYLGLGLSAYRTGSWIIRRSRDDPDLRWARNLAAMIQTSLVGYAISGAFLTLAYFDLYYTLLALLVLTQQEVVKQIYQQAVPESNSVRA